MINWVVQNNLGNHDETERIENAVCASGANLISTKVIPFSDELPDVPTTEPTFFYGATRWIGKIHKANKWSPGTYYNPKTFRYDRYIKEWGSNVLNSDGKIMTLGDLSISNYKCHDLLFIRPIKDEKEFAGEVIEFGKFADWYSKISHGEYTLGPACKVVVNEPRLIDREYRTYIVNGSVVTSSQYRVRNRLKVNTKVPEEIHKFAESCCETFCPAEIFCLDIGIVGKKLRIIEAGCINSCGLYASDENAIVSAINKFIDRS